MTGKFSPDFLNDVFSGKASLENASGGSADVSFGSIRVSAANGQVCVTFSTSGKDIYFIECPVNLLSGETLTISGISGLLKVIVE